MNLRVKLLTAFIALVIIPLCILGVIIYLVTFRSIETKHSQQAEYALKAISYSIANVFEGIDTVTDTGIARGVFQGALLPDQPDAYNLTDADQLTLNADQRYFRSILFSHPSIDFAFLYRISGDSERSRIITVFNKENFETLPYEQFKEHPLYQEVMRRNGVPVWIGPYEYPELTGSGPVFTQIRLVKELSKLQRVGILFVQIKNWEFEDIFKHLKLGDNRQTTRYLLVNDQGQILYDDEGRLNGEALQRYLSPPSGLPSGYQSFKSPFDGEESLVSIYPIQNHPWRLVSVVSWRYLSSEIVTFTRWFAAILLVCLLATMVFSLGFMNQITGTIGKIVRFMRKVEDGELGARVEEKGSGELLLLEQGFNHQMIKIHTLFDQVKREQRQKAAAELRLLQAQIKPHFLFNTLESINVLAVQNEGRKVSQMVLRLASILRISIQEADEIPLQQEIEHLRSYLDIQKFRFGDLFDYTIDIPEELLPCKLLKLTLQPLVENSLQHGFEGLDRQGRLTVTAHAERDRLLLTVADDGVGMTDRQLLALHSARSSDEELSGHPGHPERRGLGLRSVADRLRYHYGSRYGLFVCSAPGEGTTIRCVIPLQETGETNGDTTVEGPARR